MSDVGFVGFLDDKRRINVAVTRARRHIAIVCNTVTVANDPTIKSLIEYGQQMGMVRSALEYEQGK